MSACHAPERRIGAAAAGIFRVWWIRVLAIAVVQSIGATAAWASFAGQSIYHYQTYRNGWDAREYTDLNALCADATAAYSIATGIRMSSIAVNENVQQCRYEYTIQSPVIGTRPTVAQGGVNFEAIRGICPVNSFPILSIYGRTTCFCNAGATESGNACVVPQRNLAVGFFNGVWNTEKQAGDGLDALKGLMGAEFRGKPIQYEKFYNQTGRGTGNTPAQDLAETFIQRSKELDGVLADRWEHYWGLLGGRTRIEGSLTQRFIGGIRGGASGLSDLIDSLASSMLAGFVRKLAEMVSTPPTETDMAAHLSLLQAMADARDDFVLVAHSQGNLFVNVAYDALRNTRPDAQVAVVHVAPASPTVRGAHLLADIDQVINGLRNFGSWTVQPINFWLPASTADLSGHTLVGTYLDDTRQGGPQQPPQATGLTLRAQLKNMVDAALASISNKS